MKNNIFAILIASLLTIHAWSQSIEPTEISQKVSLASGKNTITYIELTNTHSRTYKDDISKNQITVNEINNNVLWKINCI